MLIRGSCLEEIKPFVSEMIKVSPGSLISLIHCPCSYRAGVSLLNTSIVQNEGDGDVRVCARLNSPAGGIEKEIFIILNNSRLI